jgi:hypothetical protein
MTTRTWAALFAATWVGWIVTWLTATGQVQLVLLSAYTLAFFVLAVERLVSLRRPRREQARRDAPR